jgi:hypothetical protein
MNGKQGKIEITTQYRESGSERQESEEHTISVHTYPSEVALAQVSATGSQTTNLGNYNSRRIAVSVTLPCAVEEIDSAFERAFEIVNQQMSRRTQS